MSGRRTDPEAWRAAEGASGPGAPGALPGAVLVLGPEGSGLALVTLVAGLLGLDLPRDAPAGGTADAPDAWVSAAVAAALAGDGTPPLEALAHGFGTAACPVVRAPGLAGELPAWADALAGAGREPAALIVLGPPPPPMGLGAWAAWTAGLLQAERATRGLRRAVIRPEALLADWRGEAGRVGRALGLDWPAWAEGERAVDACLAATPRGPQPATPSTDFGGRAARVAQAILGRWAVAGEDPADHAALDRLEAEGATPGDGAAQDGPETWVGRLARAVADLEESERRRREEAEALRAGHDRAHREAEAEHAALRDRIGRLEAEAAALRHERDQAASALRQRAAEAEDEARARAAAEATAAELQAALDRAERDLAVLRAEGLEAIRARLAALAVPPSPPSALRLAEASRLAAAEAQEAAAAARGEARKARAAEAAARAHLAEAERQLDEIRGSTSWRLTAPLRSAVSRLRRG